MQEKIVRPIGIVHTDFKEKFGVPRQSGRSPSAKGTVVLDKEFDGTSVRGLDGFSHIWLIFGFSKTEYTGAMTVRPPRLGGNKRVGVFATRSPNRPNGLGLSCVKLDGIEIKSGAVILKISGADIIDGTPVYDIKPYHAYADKIDNAAHGFIYDTLSHKLKVSIPDSFKKIFTEETLAAVTECLADDPRPSYIEDQTRIYGMTYACYEIKFSVQGDTAVVINAEKRGNNNAENFVR